MRRSILFLGLCVGLAALVGCRGGKPGQPDPGPPPVEWSADVQTVADGQNAFAIDLYKKLAADEENKGKNVFFSPYSVHAALAMTATGAKGNTRDQMVKVLHLPVDDAKVLAAGDLGRYYDHPRKDYELSVANALWGLKGFPWRPEWLATQNERFGAGFNEAEFGTNPGAERERINRWVEEKTRDRIKELLQPGQITSETTMVLTNAIYFKGKWVTQFDPKKTANAPFQCDDNTTADVPMMHTNAKCGYARTTDGVTMVELPYKGGELSMVVILPNPRDDLAALEKKLTPELIAKWFAELKDRGELQVSLPKFKTETRYELPKHLTALGMIDVFGGSADFTGMATSSPGWIAHVTHKAFVDVNEEGTEAAAATAVVMVTSSFPPPFYANRPFLFLIRDVKHGTILFMGRVMKP
ncbi:MAG: serpin family protein [Planctomycetes bacterium]|nr:serpin family protein [Planctomycetota bacterium]